MIASLTVSTLTATAILLAGVVDDFRTRKFHNWLFGVCAVAALIVAVATQGLVGLGFASAGFFAGIVVFLPLVLLKVVGAGDMKIMAAFGIVAGWNPVVNVAIFSLIWGALFGVIQVTLRGELGQVLKNIGSMAINKGKPTAAVHTIPFTAALLLGWLTDLVYQGVL